MNKIKILSISIVAIFIVVSLSAQTNQPKWYKGKCKDSIDILNVQIENLQKVIDSLTHPIVIPTEPQEKYNSEIDKSLNIEDSTIFNSKFQYFPLQSIHLRSKEFYLLIENIHTLEELLDAIKKDFDDMKQISESLKTAPVSSLNPLNQRISDLEKKIKANLESVSKLIDTINEARTKNNYLSETQNSYYKSLAKKYFEVYDQIYGN